MLGLMSTEQAWEILVCWAFIFTAAIVCTVQNVSPWEYAVMMMKAICLLVLWKLALAWLCCFVERARDNIHEPRAEVENFRVIREGQVVGEARRTQHALIAQVELGSLGKFTFTLQPTPRYG